MFKVDIQYSSFHNTTFMYQEGMIMMVRNRGQITNITTPSSNMTLTLTSGKWWDT